VAIAVVEAANMAENQMAVLVEEAEKEALEEEVQKNLGALKENLQAIMEAVAQEAEIEVATLNQKKNVSLNVEEIKQF
jgi:PHD/YefM family antitoxin component YafN of YafNO toxin-antitoxin module